MLAHGRLVMLLVPAVQVTGCHLPPLCPEGMLRKIRQASVTLLSAKKTGHRSMVIEIHHTHKQLDLNVIPNGNTFLTVVLILECRVPVNRDLCLFCSLMHIKHLHQHLAYFLYFLYHPIGGWMYTLEDFL